MSADLKLIKTNGAETDITRKAAAQFIGWYATVFLKNKKEKENDGEWAIQRGIIRRWDAHYIVLELISEGAKSRRGHKAINHDEISQAYIQDYAPERKPRKEKEDGKAKSSQQKRGRPRKTR